MSIMTLWQPILASAVIAFVAGAAIFMVMPWHKSEWSKTADEEGVRRGARTGGALRGSLDKVHVTPANVAECPEFETMIEGASGQRVLAELP